jgi:DNA repair ATPase RecN
VQQKRNAVLAARGLLEMLIQQGVKAAELLAHGVYQQSLVTPIKGKNSLGPVAVGQLNQVLDALAEAAPALSSALDECADHQVAFNASPNGLSLIATELEDCTKRLQKVSALVREWKKALTDYANMRPPTPDTAPSAVAIETPPE